MPRLRLTYGKPNSVSSSSPESLQSMGWYPSLCIVCSVLTSSAQKVLDQS